MVVTVMLMMIPNVKGQGLQYGERKFATYYNLIFDYEKYADSPLLCSSTVGGPTIDWHKIQPRLLNEAEADVLLILDCCYAASAARERPKVKNRVELLCATSMKRQTPPPGPTSFTSIMIREMKSLLSGNRGVTTSELHNHLMKQQSGLFETSVWVELQAGNGRNIKLEKLSPHIPISTPPASSLTFKVSTRQRLDENVFLEILN